MGDSHSRADPRERSLPRFDDARVECEALDDDDDEFDVE